MFCQNVAMYFALLESLDGCFSFQFMLERVLVLSEKKMLRS